MSETLAFRSVRRGPVAETTLRIVSVYGSQSIGAGLIVLILFRYTDIGVAKREDAGRCLELHLFKVQRRIPKDVGPD